MGMKRREHFSAWENSPGDFIILIISAEVWNTENNKNGKLRQKSQINWVILSIWDAFLNVSETQNQFN